MCQQLLQRTFFGLNSVHQLSLGRFVTSCFILCSISALISLTCSIFLPFGSSIPQFIKLGMNNVGQNDLSIHPILIIFVEFLIISSVISLDFCCLMSTPTSSIA